MESNHGRLVSSLLSEWAKWRHYQSGEVRGYPTAIPTERLRGSSVSSALIMDSQAEVVDRAVAKLAARCPDQGTVLKLYYLERPNLGWVGDRVTDQYGRRIGRQAATVKLRQAESAIEWILEPVLPY
jgi:hypothetical protein